MIASPSPQPTARSGESNGSRTGNDGIDRTAGRSDSPSFSDAPPVPPVVLTILDGWGYRHDDAHNAIRQADTPVM
ncbi:MAG: hypothetical protein ACK55E_11765, partial [Cyanobacteriota bacterium]